MMYVFDRSSRDDKWNSDVEKAIEMGKDENIIIDIINESDETKRSVILNS